MGAVNREGFASSLGYPNRLAANTEVGLVISVLGAPNNDLGISYAGFTSSFEPNNPL